MEQTTLQESKYSKRKANKTIFIQGLKAGIPIGMGYFAVSFAFGIQAAGVGKIGHGCAGEDHGQVSSSVKG